MTPNAQQKTAMLWFIMNGFGLESPYAFEPKQQGVLNVELFTRSRGNVDMLSTFLKLCALGKTNDDQAHALLKFEQREDIKVVEDPFEEQGVWGNIHLRLSKGEGEYEEVLSPIEDFWNSVEVKKNSWVMPVHKKPALGEGFDPVLVSFETAIVHQGSRERITLKDVVGLFELEKAKFPLLIERKAEALKYHQASELADAKVKELVQMLDGLEPDDRLSAARSMLESLGKKKDETLSMPKRIRNK